jgi:hypothetical protein
VFRRRVQADRERHVSLIRQFPVERFVWIDETAKTRSTDHNMYGYAGKGQRAYASADFERGRRLNVYAARSTLLLFDLDQSIQVCQCKLFLIIISFVKFHHACCSIAMIGVGLGIHYQVRRTNTNGDAMVEFFEGCMVCSPVHHYSVQHSVFTPLRSFIYIIMTTSTYLIFIFSCRSTERQSSSWHNRRA